MAQYRAADPATIKELAKKIYLEFIAVGSFCELNLDMNTREQILEEIENGTNLEKVFDQAERDAISLLRFSVFPLWKGTADFAEVLKSMNVTSLKEMKPSRSHEMMPSKSRSMAESEHSSV